MAIIVYPSNMRTNVLVESPESPLSEIGVREFAESGNRRFSRFQGVASDKLRPFGTFSQFPKPPSYMAFPPVFPSHETFLPPVLFIPTPIHSTYTLQQGAPLPPQFKIPGPRKRRERYPQTVPLAHPLDPPLPLAHDGIACLRMEDTAYSRARETLRS